MINFSCKLFRVPIRETNYLYIVSWIPTLLPLDKMNPPRTRTVSNANEPNVFATMIFLPNAPMNRNSAEAIWLTHMSKMNCLKNLQEQKKIH